MPDSQLREPRFESSLCYRFKVWAFSFYPWCLSPLRCINEYLAIDSGGNVSDLVIARNCCLARMLPGEAELVSEWKVQPGRAKSVKRFEQSNGLDTALYKNIPFTLAVKSTCNNIIIIIILILFSSSRYKLSVLLGYCFCAYVWSCHFIYLYALILKVIQFSYGLSCC